MNGPPTIEAALSKEFGTGVSRQDTRCPCDVPPRSGSAHALHRRRDHHRCACADDRRRPDALHAAPPPGPHDVRVDGFTVVRDSPPDRRRWHRQHRTPVARPHHGRGHHPGGERERRRGVQLARLRRRSHLPRLPWMVEDRAFRRRGSRPIRDVLRTGDRRPVARCRLQRDHRGLEAALPVRVARHRSDSPRSSSH